MCPNRRSRLVVIRRVAGGWQVLRLTSSFVTGPPESITQTAFRSVQPFAQLTADCRRARLGMSSPLQIAPSYGAIWTMWFHGPHPNGISIGSAVFAQLTTECRYILCNGLPISHLKLPHPMGDLNPLPFNTWFLGPTRDLNPNCTQTASRSVQPFLQGSLV